MNPLLVDQARVRMFQALARIRQEGVRRITVWTPEDGLPPGSSLPIHQHTMPTLAIGLEGTTRFTGREVLDLGPGEVLVIEPGCWHRHEPQRPGSTSYGQGFIAGWSDILFCTEAEVLWGAAPRDPLRGIVDRLMAAEGEGARLDLMDDLLGQVLQEQIRYLEVIHPDVLAMGVYLFNHLHLPIQVEDILRQASQSRSFSFALFKRFFGRSPRQELISQRLDLARHLVSRGMAVTEAAARAGFTTRNDFTRAHRQRYGVPPTG